MRSSQGGYHSTREKEKSLRIRESCCYPRYRGRIILLTTRNCVYTEVRSKRTNFKKIFDDSCSLHEDDLDEFMTIYDTKEIDTDEVESEVQLLTAGLEVSEELGITQSVNSRLWQRFQDDGNVSRCYSTSRPRVTTPNEDRYLAVTAKRNRRSKASDLSRQPSSATGTTVFQGRPCTDA
ncbi:uncharacterized protein TNCV_1292601 [Trichonephila clavipes]|nr:uncharacterized protein TNCV_1292601 [Trichonephila clavipes]